MASTTTTTTKAEPRRWALRLRGVWRGHAAAPADTLVIAGDRVAAIGDWRTLRHHLAGVPVRSVDAWATPGFHDAHAHPWWMAVVGERPALAALTPRAISDLADRTPPGAWVVGAGWKESPEEAVEHLPGIAQALGGRPAALWREDLHALLLDAAALRRVGSVELDATGGAVLRHPGGAGAVVLDRAADRAWSAAIEQGAVDAAWLTQGLRTVLRRIRAAGVTSVHELALPASQWPAVRTACEAPELPRLFVWLRASPDDPLPLRRIEGPRRSGRARIAGVKYFLDGALGSRGAQLCAPYADAPGWRGLALWTRDEIDALAHSLETTARAGLSVAFHALGDAAVLRAARWASWLRARVPGARVRIEHAELCGPAVLRALCACGATLGVQPAHRGADAHFLAARLGPERLGDVLPLGALRRVGVPLALGSDAPVTPCDPLGGIRHAVAPGNPWNPREHALVLAEAVEACTAGPAAAVGLAGRLGTLAPGAWADASLWSAGVERWTFEAGASQVSCAGTLVGGIAV